MSETHECVFVEEQEPGGRLVLPPCLICGLTAMDALEQLRPSRADVLGVLDELRAALAAAEQDSPQQCGHSSDPMCCPFENLPKVGAWFTAMERERLVNAVRTVHHNGDDPWSSLAPGKWCVADGEEWPCATMRALAGEVAP